MTRTTTYRFKRINMTNKKASGKSKITSTSELPFTSLDNKDSIDNNSNRINKESSEPEIDSINSAPANSSQRFDDSNNLENENNESTNTIQSDLVDTKNLIIEPIDKFRLSNKLFIEVHKSNVLQYFSRGCIFPAQYSNQRAFSDTQTELVGSMLLSNGYINFSSDFVLIEIDSEAVDHLFLDQFDNYGHYRGIIPISRIIKIFVNDTITKEKLIDDANLRDSGFIPEELIEISTRDNFKQILYEPSSAVSEYNIDEKINRFDKILGLYAGAKNYNQLIVKKTSSFKSVSDHAICVLNALSIELPPNIIDDLNPTDFYKYLINKNCPPNKPALHWLIERLHSNENFTDSDIDEFEKVCIQTNSFPSEEADLKNIFVLIRKSLERKKTFDLITRLSSKNRLALYIFSYLREYGTHQSPELARIDLINLRENDYLNYAFSTLNFFFGYSNLRNTEDRIDFSSFEFPKHFDIQFKPAIKFKLNNPFDKLIIDKVYSQVFSQPMENNYIENSMVDTIRKTDLVLNENYHNKIIKLYGINYYSFILKDSIRDEIIPQLNNLQKEIPIISEFGLLCYKIGLIPKFTSIGDIMENRKNFERIAYFSKSELIEKVKDRLVEERELTLRIELAKKNSELK